MNAIFAAALRRAPYVTLPIAVVVGAIGYNLEAILSDKHTPSPKSSIEESRIERRLQELETLEDPSNVASLKEKGFVPKTLFDKNVSPTLRDLK
ncbi:hypothetical protein B4U80_04885 [Leptotrombidium deliense]|uniref:Small integral membrane protein 12 n=1 Tax=Leptotrombidium deliense TaxID=299467 RepID=A0A443SCL9_9ACAR|nr:hypothetical protein B4U80_04885 [Leptotrombidium deliense]